MAVLRYLKVMFLALPILAMGCVHTAQKVQTSGNIQAVSADKKNGGDVADFKPFFKDDSICYAGFRRSVYGLKNKNDDDLWWAQRAIDYSKRLEKVIHKKVQPVIIEIVSGYMENGGTVFDFKRPDIYRDEVPSIMFNPFRGINHERALSLYDSLGVKAILQIESGNSDVVKDLEIINAVFGKHECIIGYGIDAEWYKYKESNDQTGVPIDDKNAEMWMNKVLSFNSSYTLFMKHWEVSHMPPTYRHENLWFLSDSQQFSSVGEMMDDFLGWASGFKKYVVGYQFGYPDDEKWWSKLENPPLDISSVIKDNIGNSKLFFWVDFTADKIRVE